MSVFVASKDSVLRALNASNSSSYTFNDVQFSKPLPVAGSWREGTTAHNTLIKVSANPTGPLEGSQYYTYDRLSLNDFSKFKPTRPLQVYNPQTTKDLLRNIQYYFGLNIQADDIIDEPLSLVDGSGTVVLKAHSDSLGWIGQIDFAVTPGGADLAALTTTKALNGLNYPIADPTKISGLMYCYPMDFTPYRDTLLAIPQDGTLTQAQADAIVPMLKALDSGGAGATLWNSTAGNVNWSIAGATVFYNGLNSAAFPTNSKFKYVLGLELRADVNVPVGRFYLQYSDPVDPNSPT